jgi:hypothetical protein
VEGGACSDSTAPSLKPTQLDYTPSHFSSIRSSCHITLFFITPTVTTAPRSVALLFFISITLYSRTKRPEVKTLGRSALLGVTERRESNSTDVRRRKATTTSSDVARRDEVWTALRANDGVDTGERQGPGARARVRVERNCADSHTEYSITEYSSCGRIHLTIHYSRKLCGVPPWGAVFGIERILRDER